MSVHAPKVVCIGLDALDKNLLLQWARTGRLPTFQSLLNRTAWGITTSPPGLFVGAIWPSFYTGVSPAEHGRYSCDQIITGSYENVRFDPKNVKKEPFWNALSRAGCKVGVIDVPKTFPSENINGIHIVDWGTHDPEGGFRTWPPALASEIAARFGTDPVGLCDSFQERGAREFASLRDALLSKVRMKQALIEHFLDEIDWDFFLAVFTESHCIGHQCWHLHDPTHPRHDTTLTAALGDPIEQVYIAIDTAVGQLLKRFGEETTVFVVASHGFGPHYEGTFLLEEALRRLERDRSQETPQRIGEILRRCWEYAPSGIRRALKPVLTSLRGKIRSGHGLPLSDELANLRFFQVPNNDTYGGIRINLVGREPYGLVCRGAEYDRLCDQLIGDLLTLVNVDTGKPAVQRVLKTTELYSGKCIDDLPDLLVEWNREAPISSLYSPKTGAIQGEYRGCRTGDHNPDGIFFASGPSISPGNLTEPVSIMRLAPSIALCLGVELPGVRAKPIFSARDRLFSNG
ncbi:MAG: alkaline phosphatase family protein [Nitrospiraceae bacterium]